MKELVKKSILLGVGLMSLGATEGVKKIRSYAKKTKMTKNEGEKMVKSYLSEINKMEKKIERKVDERIKIIMKKQPFVTKKDLKEFETKLKKSFKKK